MRPQKWGVCGRYLHWSLVQVLPAASQQNWNSCSFSFLDLMHWSYDFLGEPCKTYLGRFVNNCMFEWADGEVKGCED